MTVLSLCTEVECGFQSHISIKERLTPGIIAAAAAVTIAGQAATAAVAAAVAAPAGAAAAAIAAGTAAAGALAAPAAAATAVAGASFCVGNYFYKRLTWNNKAKEIEFKRQFVAHVTKQQQLIVDSTSADCSNQVKQ
jgi:hypothetical protein